MKFSSLYDIRDNRKDLHYILQLLLMMSNHPLVIVLHMCRETFTCIHINAQIGELSMCADDTCVQKKVCED